MPFREGDDGQQTWPESRRRSSTIGTGSDSSASAALPPTAAKAARKEKLATIPGWMRQGIAERAKLVGVAAALQEQPLLKQVISRATVYDWIAALEERGSCSPVKEYTRGPKRKLQGDSLQQLLESGERGEYGTQGGPSP